MEDPGPERNERRRREEEMERMLLEQEAAEDALADAEHRHEDGDDDDNDILGDQHRHNDDDLLLQNNQQQQQSVSSRPKLSYATLSFSAAFGLLWYALRTRQQWYLALVFLGSSKYAYIVLGNAIIASCMQLFDVLVGNFLNGLRLVEREGLSEFFRWNITETCLALTMFRSELTVESGIYFLLLVLGKCLHWVVEQRESHLRMTQDAVTARGPGLFAGYPKLHSPQLGLLSLLQILIVLDVIAVVCCIQHVATHGPSVQLLFGFESAILLVSAMSLLLLAGLHVLDGLLHYMHDTFKSFSISSWKDRKATLIFAMEVQAQGAKFVFYVTFFLIVFTYYGLPMNLFREVYTSFHQLRLRLVAFGKYRKLVKSMNRYPAPDEALLLADNNEACIICRDDMCARDSKQLPGCGHIFHTSCLREWLVQQQTCPTCRGDISVNEARAKREEEAAREEAEAAIEEVIAGLQESVEAQQEDAAGQESILAAAAAARIEAAKEELRSTGQQAHGTPRSTIMSSAAPVVAPSAPPAAQDDSKPPAAATTTTSQASSSSQVFPALYKVVGMTPAPVYNLNNNDTTTNTNSTPVRHVTPGTAILCLEMELQTVGEDLGLMMRIPPNEWIWENQVEYLTTIPST